MPNSNKVVTSRDVIFKETIPTFSLDIEKRNKELSSNQIDEQNDTQDIEKIESNVQTSDVYNLRDRSNMSKPQRYIDAEINIAEGLEPKTYKEAMDSPNAQFWKEAMNEEMNSLTENDVYECTTLPPGQKPIDCKWVLKTKLNSKGEITIYKARHWWQKGFNNGTDLVWKLKKSLYGLKQSPRFWNQKIVNFMKERCLKENTADPCLFFRKTNDQLLIIAIYVDDGIVAGTNEQEIKEFLDELMLSFKITSEPLNYFLANKVGTPTDNSTVPGEAEILENVPFREAIGSLMHLSCLTRPDITFALNKVSQKLAAPTKYDWEAVKRIFKYLVGTTEYGIMYQKGHKVGVLESFSDADFAGDPETRRSTSGVVCKLAGGAISWLSQKQRSVSLSTTEAELVAASNTAKEVIWLNRLFSEISPLKEQPIIKVDNASTIKLIKNLEFHKRTKHIEVRHYFVREKYQEGIFNVEHISGKDQVADIMTKGLPKPRFQMLRYLLETLVLMNEAYEDEKLSQTQVYFWYKRFKDGRKSIADDSRSGRPLMSTTDRNIGQLIRSSRKILADDLKWRAVGRMEAGQSQVEVAKWLNVNKSVVSKIWKQFIETGTIKRKEGSGIKRKTATSEDRYLVVTAKRHREMTAIQLSNELSSAIGTRISRQTVYRRLHEGAVYARRPMVCITLTSAHRRARLNWCLEHHAWTHDQWANVLFSDESRFSLNTDSRRVFIWREPGTRYHSSNIREIDSFSGGSLLVWAGIRLCEALIDTGADLSVVDLRTALFAGREINSLTKTCSGPDGKKLDMVGSIILDLKIDDTELSHEFVVMDAHLRTLILGRDFLKKMNAKIDCERETIKYNLMSNHDVSKYDLKKIKSTTDTVILKLSIKLIRASIEAEDGEYVIEENNRMTQTNGLRLARSLLTVTDKKTHIWITNPYPRPLKIMKDQTLAYGSLPAGVNFIENKEKQNENDEIQFQINKNLSFKEQERLKQILAKYTDLFSSRLGRTSLAKHQIHTEDAKPIKHKPYRVSAKERTIIKDQIDEMLEEGIIRQSSSPWSFPVILVKKRDGKYRFCVDYRKLNEVTVKDVYPIPRIDDVMDTLQGSKYFSAIDLKSGYWQVEIEERDKEKTAFTTAHGLYEFNVMPFGLCNAPATFERNMDNVLGNLRWQICLCYLDDVIIYSSDFPTHIRRLEAVLRCFSESNLKLNAKKCRFAFEELEILGHITNQEGIKPAEYNIKAVRDFPQPKKAKEVQSFLGMCSYYRKFIKDFSLIADPLTSLIRKNVQFIWTGQQEEAFQNLKKALMNPPILGHFDPNAATCIHTDASNIGLGATLIQNIGGEEKENLRGNKRSITQNFKEENGCLYKKNPNPEGREWLLVVPKKRRKEIMSEYHNHMLNGHLGVARTTYRLKNKYYWPSMLNDVSEFVKTCHLCQSRKGSNQLPSGLLQPIPPANYPFEKIGIDFVGPLPSTKRRRKWIIVLTDYYTKYAETKAVPEATVKEVSTFLIEHIFLRHGAPRFLISDRGSQFTRNLMKEVMKMCKVKHCFTTSYHPQTNGLTERLNRTLINMISMYVNTDQKNWDEILPFITHAYNTTIQETTGYSPFFLLFGREPMSLLDDENIPTDSNMDDYDEYIENYLDKIARRDETGSH
ncbi:hypothetical protein LAZ67_3004955 [Cordylochernes scorpioides]|uniref:RNA-directed DNA polymerase n=1 Tax=Cordylochernes scorpioides TaxID=51811 RepID=A0ABY6K9X0_9ARAC|nr:hypothetical protein LAZ67_3004955 [Cordylochernes scorpioides]